MLPHGWRYEVTTPKPDLVLGAKGEVTVIQDDIEDMLRRSTDATAVYSAICTSNVRVAVSPLESFAATWKRSLPFAPACAV